MELRAMTNSEGKRDGAVMMSSKMLLSAENSASARCSYWQKGEGRARALAAYSLRQRPYRSPEDIHDDRADRDVDRAGAAMALMPAERPRAVA
jgi:hypothetical protein